MDRHTSMTVRLPVQLIDQIEEYAQKKDWTRSRAVREACMAMIRQRTRKAKQVEEPEHLTTTPDSGNVNAAKCDGNTGDGNVG